MLVDSHCHLNFPDFKDDLDVVITAAKAQGVQTFLTVNTALSEAEDLQHIAERFADVYCSVGVHPHEAEAHVKAASGASGILEDLCEKAAHPKVIALGETGLDYYYNHSPREPQITSFEAHIEASQKLNLPLIIHTREADEDTVTSLLKVGKKNVQGVFHCFSGGEELARKALDLGFYISFSGIITFKKAETLRAVARFVPLDRILIETDAPFLAPIPHRGKRNEPAFVRFTALILAELRGLSLEEIGEATTQNFYRLFQRCKKP